MKRVPWTPFVFCLWVLGVLPVPFGQSAELGKKSRFPLSMEVFLKKPMEHLYEIHIHLTNSNPEPVTVNLRDLPWIPPNDAQWILAFRMDSRHSLVEQNSFPGKFGARSIRLVPGESVQGKLVLNHRIPTLLEDIKLFGVRLQWECSHPSLQVACKQDAPHTIIIPKDDPGEPDVYVINESACRRMERVIGFIDVPQGHEVLFLLTRESVVTDLEKVHTLLYQVADYVQQCRPTWTNSWAVDFFAEERVAGFLRDQEGRQYFEKGLWQKTNIGQYSSQIRTLYRFPWSRKKADTLYLSVYCDGERAEIR